MFQNPPNQEVSTGSIASKIKSLNVVNLVIFTGSITCLLLALDWGGTKLPWSNGKVISLFVLAGIAFGAFVTLEMLQKGRSTIPRSVLLNRTAGLCLVYAFCASAAFNVIDYFVSFGIEHDT
jgi:ABC-type transport system involved in cytochrome c biogenesis permease subunit